MCVSPFLPNLRVLIVLIDDAFHIDALWKVKKNIGSSRRYCQTYVRYQGAMRYGFVHDSLGPFKDIRNNRDYAEAIRDETIESFSFEEDTLRTMDYYAPEIIVKSAQLKPGNELWDSGRYPSNYLLP